MRTERQAFSLSFPSVFLIDRHSSFFVFTRRKISCHRFQQFTHRLHTTRKYTVSTSKPTIMSRSLFTHPIIPVRVDWMKTKMSKRNWNRQRVFLYLLTGANAACKHMIESCFNTNKLFSCSLNRCAPESREWNDRFGSLFTSETHARERHAEHTTKQNCTGARVSVLWRDHLIHRHRSRHDPAWSLCRVCKQNGNNWLAFIRHYLLRIQSVSRIRTLSIERVHNE